MTKQTDEEETDEYPSSPGWVFPLVITGVILVFAGIALVIAAGLSGGGSVSSGVVIFIGPFPIAFGSGPSSGFLILVGIIIAAVSIAIFVVMRRRSLAQLS